jgi:hypothetical protein
MTNFKYIDILQYNAKVQLHETALVSDIMHAKYTTFFYV